MNVARYLNDSPSPGDASALQERREPSAVDERRPCDWCRSPRLATRGRFCSRKCRQSAWRIRQRATLAAPDDGRPLAFAYADPPYPGLSAKYYRHEASYGGEVDHRALIASLVDGRPYAGWALSTSARALRDVLPLCPLGARVCAWVKPGGAPTATYGLHNVWEPLIVVGGRQRRPGKRDAFVAHPARGGGKLPGRKPLAFCAFLFEALGMHPGDTLADLFPGSGIVGRAWDELSSAPAAATPQAAHDDAAAPDDGSQPGADDAP